METAAITHLGCLWYPPAVPEKLLYMIHASEDQTLAGFLTSEVEAKTGWTVFVASKAGQIPTGADWLEVIQNNLRRATAFLVLVTLASLERWWVWYEAGAAWLSARPRFHVAAGGIELGKIPLPLGATQTLAIESPDNAEQLFRQLGGELPDSASFCRTVKRLSSERTSEAQAAAAREAVGSLGNPPKEILQHLLSTRSMTLAEMQTALSPRYPAGPEYVERVRDALKKADFIEGNAAGQWAIRREMRQIAEECLEPPLSQQLLEVAGNLQRLGHDDDGPSSSSPRHRPFRPTGVEPSRSRGGTVVVPGKMRSDTEST